MNHPDVLIDGRVSDVNGKGERPAESAPKGVREGKGARFPWIWLASKPPCCKSWARACGFANPAVMHASLSLSLSLYIYIYIYCYVYVCVYIYMYKYIYIYIYIHTYVRGLGPGPSPLLLAKSLLEEGGQQEAKQAMRTRFPGNPLAEAGAGAKAAAKGKSGKAAKALPPTTATDRPAPPKSLPRCSPLTPRPPTQDLSPAIHCPPSAAHSPVALSRPPSQRACGPEGKAVLEASLRPVEPAGSVACLLARPPR